MKHEVIDHDKVVEMWAGGMTGNAIGDLLSIRPNYARTIVQRAREQGDPRAVKRRPGRPVRPPAGKYLEMEAYQRGITPGLLRRRILDAVIEGRLITAVLDH